MEVRDRVSQVEQGARRIFEERMQILRELTMADDQISDTEEKIANLGKDLTVQRKVRRQLYERAVRDGWKPHELESLNLAAEPGRPRGRPRAAGGRQRKPRTVQADSAAAPVAPEESGLASEEGQRQDAQPSSTYSSWSEASQHE